MAIGRPPFYESPEKLQEGINEYFEHIKGEKEDLLGKDEEGNTITIGEKWNRYPEPATITGLVLYLGFNDRQSLYDYQEKEEFTCIIKNARTKVECEYEKRLAGQSPTGAIFALKNMGWKDKTEMDSNINLRQMKPVYITKDGQTE